MVARSANVSDVQDAIATDPEMGWEAITRMAAKADIYRRETYFREGLADAESALGADAAAVLCRSALVIVKADGLLAGKLSLIHDFLTEHDLRPVAARQIRFTRMLAREFWRFQLTLASLDRLAVNDWVLTVGPALVLLLHSDGTHELPATVRLSGLKGDSNPHDQDPDSLRGRLGQPNRLVNFFHCADEPADIIREIGMLFDRSARLELLAAMASGRMPAPDAATLATALADRTRPRSLDVTESVHRITAAVARCDLSHLDPAARAVLGDGLDAMRTNRTLSWRPFEAALLTVGAELDPWDVAMIGSSFIDNDVPGGSKVLVNPDRESWRT